MTALSDDNSSRGESRRALLLGCGQYEHRSDLRAPGRDVERMGSLLKQKEYDVKEIVDRGYALMKQEIESFFAQADRFDAINLLYLSCHGVLDGKSNLHFLFADSDPEHYLGSTGVAAAWVLEQILESRSVRTVVLVDCCFSGAFPLPGSRRGVALLTSSGPLEPSSESVGEDLEMGLPTSYFTEAILTGIQTGKADRDGNGVIEFDELCAYVDDQVRRGPSPQRPHSARSMGSGRIVIATAPRDEAASNPLRAVKSSPRGRAHGTVSSIRNAMKRLQRLVARWVAAEVNEWKAHVKGAIIGVAILLSVIGASAVVAIWMSFQNSSSNSELPTLPTPSLGAIAAIPFDVSRRSARPGDAVIVRGGGLQPHEIVQITLSSEVVGSGRTDSQGRYKILMHVPHSYDGLGRVPTQLAFIAETSFAFAAVDFVVDPAAPEPAVTRHSTRTL